MAIRTTAIKVGKIVDVDAGDDLSAYIESANSLLEAVCGASLYTEGKFELIERWLAAHFYACNRIRTERSTVFGGVSEQLQTQKLDLRLNNTVYGQQAMTLDTDGSLAAYNNALDDVKAVLPAGRIGVTWLGSKYHVPRGG